MLDWFQPRRVFDAALFGFDLKLGSWPRLGLRGLSIPLGPNQAGKCSCGAAGSRVLGVEASTFRLMLIG